MATVTKPPSEQARTIFSDLGYDVCGDGDEFRAERKWRVVRVTATTETDTDETPDDGELRCFVTWKDDAPGLRRELRRRNPEYEWALIGVRKGGDGDYEVVRAPPSKTRAV